MLVAAYSIALHITFEGLLLMVISIKRKVASSRTKILSRLEYKSCALFKTNMVKIDTLFITKTAV